MDFNKQKQKNMRGMHVLDVIWLKTFCRVESYILTYLFTPKENITKPITQEI